MIMAWACDGMVVPTVAIFFSRWRWRTTLPAPIGPFDPMDMMPRTSG